MIEPNLITGELARPTKGARFWQGAGVLARWALALGALVSLVPAIGQISDFRSGLYPAAWSVLHGHSLYGAALSEAAAGTRPGAYAYPPPFALVSAPIALLSYPAAARFWYLLNLGFLVSAAFVAGRLWAPGRNQWRAAASSLAVLVGFGPILSTLGQGQLDILVLLLTMTAIALLRSGSQGMAGLMLGLATVIKIYPFGFIVYSALVRQFRVVAVALLTIVTSIVAAIVVLGSRTLADYGQLLQFSGEPGWLAHPSSFGVVSFFYRALTPTRWATPIVTLPSGLVRLGYALIAAVVAIAVAVVVLNAERRFSLAQLSLVACATLLVFPFINDGHLLLLLAVLPGFGVSVWSKLGAGGLSHAARQRVALLAVYTPLTLAIANSVAIRVQLHHASLIAPLVLLVVIGLASSELADWSVNLAIRVAVIGGAAAFFFLAAPTYVGMAAWGGVPISRVHLILGEGQLAMLAVIFTLLGLVITLCGRQTTMAGPPVEAVEKLAGVGRA